MKIKTAILVFTAFSLLVTGVSSCTSATTVVEDDGTDGEIVRPVGWTEESHGNSAEPDYDVVFPQDRVNELKITIDSDDWATMQQDMETLFGKKGVNQQGGFFGNFKNNGVDPGQLPRFGGIVPDSGNITPGMVMPGFGGIAPNSENTTPGNRFPGFPVIPQGGDVRQPGLLDMTAENPVWVEATLEFDNETWTHVGIRYKGNSSLASSWRNGTLKLPLKLDFDEFEDEYPEITNQRFYGFKQLSLSNAFNDPTYMRDTVAADILKESGLIAAETAYCNIIVDYGEGEVDLGLYVVIEVVDDTVIESYYGDDSGNIYEGDGRGVSLAAGTSAVIEDSFLKENNEDEADWSDIEELYNILHSNLRTTDPEAWRQKLESVFDVDSFLNWLAIAGIIQHWDSYGTMAHNFYLYHEPQTGLLKWISWDHNQVLEGARTGIRAARVGMGLGGNMSLSRDEVTRQWPLIRFLLDDPVYHARYLGFIETTLNGPFDPAEIAAKCEKLAELVRPYINKDDENAFEQAVDRLIQTVNERYEAAEQFLEEER